MALLAVDDGVSDNEEISFGRSGARRFEIPRSAPRCEVAPPLTFATQAFQMAGSADGTTFKVIPYAKFSAIPLSLGADGAGSEVSISADSQARLGKMLGPSAEDNSRLSRGPFRVSRYSCCRRLISFFAR